MIVALKKTGALTPKGCYGFPGKYVIPSGFEKAFPIFYNHAIPSGLRLNL